MQTMTDKLQPQFAEILVLIQNAQNYVIATSNQELLKLGALVNLKTLALKFFIIFDVSYDRH